MKQVFHFFLPVVVNLMKFLLVWVLNEFEKFLLLPKNKHHVLYLLTKLMLLDLATLSVAQLQSIGVEDTAAALVGLDQTTGAIVGAMLVSAQLRPGETCHSVWASEGKYHIIIEKSDCKSLYMSTSPL